MNTNNAYTQSAMGGTARVTSASLKSSAPRAMGYFAFPPILAPDGRTTFAFTMNEPLKEDPQILRQRQERAAREAEAARKEAAWQERCRRDAQLRQERLERERAEALVGEMDWVRIGGSLRDAKGRRDVARTEQLRAEVRLLDEEARLTALWDAYERRWQALLASSIPVTFADVPWPLPSPPASAEELVPCAIEDFLFSPLRVRRNIVTKRERIRASLLRWHPDKVSAVMQRVVPDDEVAVREGINAVFRCLKALQDTERQR